MIAPCDVGNPDVMAAKTLWLDFMGNKFLPGTVCLLIVWCKLMLDCVMDMNRNLY